MFEVEESGSQKHCLLVGNSVFTIAFWQPLEQRNLEISTVTNAIL